MENQDKKQILFENKISKISVLIALAGVLIAAVGLIPQFKSAYSSQDKINISRNFSGRKVESIVEDVVDEYFDDAAVRVDEKDNGGKAIHVSIYVYNEDQLKAEKAVAMAEELYGMSAEDDSGIIGMTFSFTSHTGVVKIKDSNQTMTIPLVIWNVIKTSTMDGETIWVSDIIAANLYENIDIFKYEYDKSDIFGKINDTNYNLEETHFSEDYEYAVTP